MLEDGPLISLAQVSNDDEYQGQVWQSSDTQRDTVSVVSQQFNHDKSQVKP